MRVLRLALLQARALGSLRARITCDDDKLGSIKVIERNGGVLKSRTIFENAVRQCDVPC